MARIVGWPRHACNRRESPTCPACRTAPPPGASEAHPAFPTKHSSTAGVVLRLGELLAARGAASYWPAPPRVLSSAISRVSLRTCTLQPRTMHAAPCKSAAAPMHAGPPPHSSILRVGAPNMASRCPSAACMAGSLNGTGPIRHRRVAFHAPRHDAAAALHLRLC